MRPLCESQAGHFCQPLFWASLCERGATIAGSNKEASITMCRLSVLSDECIQICVCVRVCSFVLSLYLCVLATLKSMHSKDVRLFLLFECQFIGDSIASHPKTARIDCTAIALLLKLRLNYLVGNGVTAVKSVLNIPHTFAL